MDYSSATHNLWQRVFSHLHGCSKRVGPDAAAHNRSIRLVCCDRSLANRQSCRTTVQQLNYRPIERKFTSSTWNVRHQKDLWNGAVSPMKKCTALFYCIHCICFSYYTHYSFAFSLRLLSLFFFKTAMRWYQHQLENLDSSLVKSSWTWTSSCLRCTVVFCPPS